MDIDIDIGVSHTAVMRERVMKQYYVDDLHAIVTSCLIRSGPYSDPNRRRHCLELGFALHLVWRGGLEEVACQAKMRDQSFATLLRLWQVPVVPSTRSTSGGGLQRSVDAHISQRRLSVFCQAPSRSLGVAEKFKDGGSHLAFARATLVATLLVMLSFLLHVAHQITLVPRTQRTREHCCAWQYSSLIR